LPFRRPALRRGQPGPRHRDLDRPERARQRARPAAMTVALDAGSCFIAGHLASFVTRPCQRGIELAADQLFDELTRPSPYLSLDRVEPVVEKINSHLSRRLHGIRLRGKLGDGVVSSPTLLRRMIRGWSPPETTPTLIPTNPATAPHAGGTCDTVVEEEDNGRQIVGLPLPASFEAVV